MSQKFIKPETPHIHTSGVTSSKTVASRQLRVLALVFDFFLVSFFCFYCLFIFKIIFFPTVYFLFIFLLVCSIYYFIQKKIFGLTLGERVWRLKTRGSNKKFLYQKDHPTFIEQTGSSLGTAIICLVTFIEIHTTVFNQPLWKKISIWNLEAAIQPPSWVLLPFFYHMGSWPSSFLDQPIFYTLTYQNGPPKKFVGQIEAHLKDPDILLIIEGPKTPLGVGSQKEIKNCFINPNNSYNCLSQRYQTLSRHIEEIETLSQSYSDHSAHSVQWDLQWFQVSNPSLSPEDQAQGVHLRASEQGTTSGHFWMQDRFILINSIGIHQTLILNQLNSSEPETSGILDSRNGQIAYEMLLKTIKTLRSFSDLDAGRAWINRALEMIDLEAIKSNPDTGNLTSELARVQSLLISKISVDPGRIDSYFHLAGTSLLLGSDPKINTQAEPPNNPRRKAALQNIQTSYRFAQDILPNDPRINQIENMVQELKKKLSF